MNSTNNNEATNEKSNDSSESLTSTSTSSSCVASGTQNSASPSTSTGNIDDVTSDAFLTPCSSIVTDVYVNEGEEFEDENKMSNEKRKFHRGVDDLMHTGQESLTLTDGKRNNPQNEHDHQSLCTKSSFISTRTPFKSSSNSPRNYYAFSPELQSFITSISSKASPLALKSWIALSLTLDGRDKITKVIQYTSRFLGFYYETLAAGISQQHDITSTIYATYVFKAKKFRRLYKALTTSRKAFRFGRTFIEIDKLKQMGFLHWVAWYLRKNMFVHDDNNGEKSSNNEESFKNLQKMDSTDSCGAFKSQESTVSFHPNTKFQKDEHNDVPPRIILPRQVSSNVGYKPSSFAYDESNKSSSLLKQLSTIGRLTYLSLSSVIDDDMLVEKGSDGIHQTKSPPPLWKILSSAFKIIGLAGFWAGDNISYLYSIGFLVDNNDPKNIDLGVKSTRRKSAANFATRSYFFAAVAGLYFNSREWYNHRNGPYVRTRRKMDELKKEMEELKNSNNANKAYAQHKYRQELESLEKAFEDIKHKHFKICLALLKSCCDVTVFSNNPGVDLHLKYRGHKMNEGIQCLCGTTSALTVIYNNYPSATKK